MSHFSVIVIGENIKEQLEKYYEGYENEDKSAYIFKNEESVGLTKYKEKLVNCVILENGKVYLSTDMNFRVGDKYVYPKGSILAERKFCEVYSTFEEFMVEYEGFDERDSKTGFYGYWENPHAKWDWYEVGGRWSKFFKVKNKGWVNSLVVSDLDIEGMQEKSRKEANKTYDELEKILKGREIPSWNEVLKNCNENLELARLNYNSMEVVRDLTKEGFYTFSDLREIFGPNREEYVQRCVNNSLVTFALVKDGEWYEKGKMGWFGVTIDEMDNNVWLEFIQKTLSDLPSNTRLTIVDCHI